jgi:hypothetical protein
MSMVSYTDPTQTWNRTGRSSLVFTGLFFNFEKFLVALKLAILLVFNDFYDFNDQEI